MQKHLQNAQKHQLRTFTIYLSKYGLDIYKKKNKMLYSTSKVVLDDVSESRNHRLWNQK